MTYFVSKWAELLILVAGQPVDWKGVQPGWVGSGKVEGWGGRAIQNSVQQPWVVPKQELRVVVGGSASLRRATGWSRHHAESWWTDSYSKVSIVLANNPMRDVYVY